MGAIELRSNTAKLWEILRNHGFQKRGNAFFRVHGDGILQIIRNKTERIFQTYQIDVGLFSLYSEMQSQWFTANGCIPQYNVFNFIGIAEIGFLLKHDGAVMNSSSDEEKINLIVDHVLPVLNDMVTQQRLVDTMCALDIAQYGEIIWRRKDKLSPYLVARDWESAERVIQTSYYYNNAGKAKTLEMLRLYMGPEVSECKERRISETNIALERLLSLVQTRDSRVVDEYLQGNYEKNREYAKFCMIRR